MGSPAYVYIYIYVGHKDVGSHVHTLVHVSGSGIAATLSGIGGWWGTSQ